MIQLLKQITFDSTFFLFDSTKIKMVQQLENNKIFTVNSKFIGVIATINMWLVLHIDMLLLYDFTYRR